MAQTTVFAFKFKKDIWSPSKARTWLRKHGHRASDLHEDDGTFSLVQRPRSDFGPTLTQKAHSPSHPGVFEVRGILKSDMGKQAKPTRKKTARKAASKPKKAAKKRAKSTVAKPKKVARKAATKPKKLGKKRSKATSTSRKKAARKTPTKPKKPSKKRAKKAGKKKATKRSALPTFKPGELVGVLERRGGKVTHWAHVVSVAGRMVVIRSDGTQRAVKATHLLPVPKKAEVK